MIPFELKDAMQIHRLYTCRYQTSNIHLLELYPVNLNSVKRDLNQAKTIFKWDGSPQFLHLSKPKILKRQTILALFLMKAFKSFNMLVKQNLKSAS